MISEIVPFCFPNNVDPACYGAVSTHHARLATLTMIKNDFRIHNSRGRKAHACIITTVWHVYDHGNSLKGYTRQQCIVPLIPREDGMNLVWYSENHLACIYPSVQGRVHVTLVLHLATDGRNAIFSLIEYPPHGLSFRGYRSLVWMDRVDASCVGSPRRPRVRRTRLLRLRLLRNRPQAQTYFVCPPSVASVAASTVVGVSCSLRSWIALFMLWAPCVE